MSDQTAPDYKSESPFTDSPDGPGILGHEYPAVVAGTGGGWMPSSAPGGSIATPLREPPSSEEMLVREAARELARVTLLPELQSLLDEREQLVQKKFAEGITQEETGRLNYIRWKLDRIDDALVGADLDRLEGLAQLQENLAGTIAAYWQQVQALAAKAGHRIPRKR